MKKTKKKMSVGKKIAIGAGVAAVAAGAYYFLGPKGKEHQKKAKDLMAKLKKEVESRMKKAKDSTKSMYNKTIDIVSSSYAKKYKAHAGEIKALAKKLKSDFKGAPKFAKKTAQKVVRKLKK